ncbi:MAG: reverse transcriptase family protein [Clostridium sp.]
MEKTFQEDKLLEIINSFSLNKSPGSDGLPIEFYKCFWNTVKGPIIANYNSIMTNKELSITQKQGVISLIPKKDKDPKKIKNWRPITLLNTDYKILTKYIAWYLKDHLVDIIHNNQKGFLPGRYIGENVNNAIAISEYCKTNNIDALLIFLDYNKAFDSVEWEIVERSLKYFGFKQNIIQYVKYIYTDNSSCIINNGHISNFFKISRGLRQGCPLSPYLFIIVVEILAIMIRSNKKIQGVSINNNVHKLSQYADDTFISTLNTDESVNELFKLITEFSMISGLTLNKDKTEVLHIGKNPCSMYIDKTWLRHEINLLGVKINVDANKTIDSNYCDKLIKIGNCLKIWKQRDLSLLGKIHIIKSLASSQLVYSWSNLPKPPESFFKELDTKIYNFLWNSKIDRVKRSTMIAPYHEGGLKMIDSRTQCKSLKLKWITNIKKQYQSSSKDFWYMWVLQGIPNMDMIDFLKCNLNTTDLSNVCKWEKHSFWYEVFSVWCEFNYAQHPQCKEYIINQPIWYNSLLKIGGKPVFLQKWYKKCVKNVKDLIAGNKWITIKELKSRYDITTNFLELRGLINCMPKYWKYIIFQESDIEFNGYKIENSILTCKETYQELLKTKICIPEQYVSMWEKLLETEIDEIEWYESYIDCFTWTISTKLRSFYYQIRVGDIMTNKKLVQMKIKNDSTCTWCNDNVQDLIHLFWDCTKINTLWSELSHWLSACIGCYLDIKKELVFLHDIEAGNYTIIINLVILIATRYIYVCKCLDHIPTFRGIINKISEIEFLERKISTDNGKLYSHNKKWRQLSNYL